MGCVFCAQRRATYPRAEIPNGGKLWKTRERGARDPISGLGSTLAIALRIAEIADLPVDESSKRRGISPSRIRISVFFAPWTEKTS